MKQIFLDLETSGLESEKHGIWQIAARLFKDGKEQETFLIECNIFDYQEWNHVARNMCHIESFKSIRTARHAYKSLKKFLDAWIDPYDTKDKAFLYAYNSGFDEEFLREFFINNNDKYFGSYFFNPVIDIMSLAGEYLKDVRFEMKNFKQATVARKLDIPVVESKLHDAMYDIEIARLIYEKVTEDKNAKTTKAS